jgi:deoxyribose-phosphate aldolase
MYIEYAYYDLSSNEAETKQNINQAIKLGVQNLSVLPSYVKMAKSITQNLLVSCPIDYPLGVLDLKSRISAVEGAIKNGVDIVDVVCPAYPLCHRKYDKFREDIKNLKDLCDYNKIQLRYFLEYRIYSYDLLYKIAQVLLEFDVNICFPSTGHLLDDINDNLIATAMINKKTEKINMIINGNVWNSSQVNLIFKSKPYGIRLNSINSLQLILENSKKIAD